MAKKPMSDAQKNRKANARGLDRDRLSNAKTMAMIKGTSGELGSYMGSSAYNKLRKERDQLRREQDAISEDAKRLRKEEAIRRAENAIAKIDKKLKDKSGMAKGGMTKKGCK